MRTILRAGRREAVPHSGRNGLPRLRRLLRPAACTPAPLSHGGDAVSGPPSFAQPHEVARRWSESEVATGGGLQCLDGADVALDQDVDAPVAGLRGDPVDADAGECGAGGVAGAQ